MKRIAVISMLMISLATANETIRYPSALLESVEFLKKKDQAGVIHVDPPMLCRWVATFQTDAGPDGPKQIRLAIHSPARTFRSPGEKAIGKRFDLLVKPSKKGVAATGVIRPARTEKMK